MADDEYVEGDSNSEAADAPGAVPAEDDSKPRGAVIDSVSVQDAPVQQLRRSTARNAQARKAFAEAILANKNKPVPEDLEDPEDVALAAAETPVTEKPAEAELAAAKAAAADPRPAEAPVAPPAPSLDPEIRRIRDELKAEREAIAQERAELDKAKAAPPPPDALSLEEYIDSAPRAYRNWLENMRGEKFASDDDFKTEVSDFITQLSAEVLGVPLPEATRTKLEAALARKAVRTSKTIQAKKEAALAARLEKERAESATKAEQERVEQEWAKAATVLSQQFAPTLDATGKPQASQAAAAYPWLATYDDPGKVIVDVIKTQLTKDGTQLSWQEASKRADNFLATQWKRDYEKRKALLASAAPAPAAPAAAKAKPAAAPAATAPAAAAPATATAVNGEKKWSRDKHIENSKAAFRRMLANQTTE